jgi:hypothetical protein
MTHNCITQWFHKDELNYTHQNDILHNDTQMYNTSQNDTQQNDMQQLIAMNKDTQ